MVKSEARNESIRICAYFFEVLIVKFLEFEKAAQSQSVTRTGFDGHHKHQVK